MRVRVLHAYYGCETGCCGHILEIDGESEYRTFTFHHFDKHDPASALDQMVAAIDGRPHEIDEDVRDYILKHIPKECHDSIDWNSVEVEDCPYC